MIFDSHGDILTDIYEEVQKGNNDSFLTKHYPKYKKGKITQSIFVNWTDPDHKTKEYFYDVFDVAVNELNKYKDILKICTNHQDLVEAHEDHKLGIILGIEGLKYLDKPEDIIPLYQKGIRHAILTWNEENKYASGVSFPDTGLTDEGRKLISIMEEYHMIIDLSHANLKTFNDIIHYTKGPIIVSHSNAKALCDHRRNLSDEQLLKIKEKNGVVGVCAVANFISSDKDKQTVQYMAKHIDYMVKLIGIDYVGLGLDVCYYLYQNHDSTGVKGLETIEDAYHITNELKELNYSKEDIDKILYKNFNRVIKDILK